MKRGDATTNQSTRNWSNETENADGVSGAQKQLSRIMVPPPCEGCHHLAAGTVPIGGQGYDQRS
jgi:hypothetical protein